MTSGQANGRDRRYEQACKDVVLHVFQELGLRPYSGDGIGVPFPDVGGTPKTFDIALRAADGSLLICECKRHRHRIKLDHLLSFARALDLLRESTGLHVRAALLTKSGAQIGALRHANWMRARCEPMEVIEFDEGQDPAHWTLAYVGHSNERAVALRRHCWHTELAPRVEMSGRFVAKRVDGTVELDET